ncbi:plasmid mobilization relaxosome protein MobC [Mucilaginibacter sp. UC70_90]
MKDNNNNNNKAIKDKWLHVRLSEKEQQQLSYQFSKTTERKLSAYARKILLGKPMISGYRNQSLDILIAEFITLNKTLNGIANNYNQSIHKLHTFDHFPQVKIWLDQQQKAPEHLLQSIASVKILVQKILEHGGSY